MDKTSQKVTKDKDPKRVDAGRKGRESFMKKSKEKTLNDAKKGGGATINSSNDATSPTTNSNNDTTSATNTTTTRSNDIYVYRVRIIAVHAITGVCVFFAHNISSLKNSSMKKRINHNDFMSLKNLYNI